MSSASFASGPPSDHEDMTISQSYQSLEGSRRLQERLDPRLTDLSSGTTTTIENEPQYGKTDRLVVVVIERDMYRYRPDLCSRGNIIRLHER